MVNATVAARARLAHWLDPTLEPRDLEETIGNPNVDFDTRFAILVDAEHIARDNKKVARLLREAKLRLTSACVEDIDYSPKREIDKSMMRQLSTCTWAREHLNIVITGMTGVGKTCLGSAGSRLGELIVNGGNEEAK